MTEHDIRVRVYALDLKPNTKLTLLGVMCFVNWETWSGPCSARDVSKKMSINERAVKRALKELTELNMISRSAQRRSLNNHHRAITVVNVSVIMRGVNVSPPSDNKTLPPSDIVTPPSDNMTLPPSDNKTLPQCQYVTPPSDNMTLPPSDIVTPNTTEDYNRGDNRETTEETQQTSLPDDDAQTVEADEAVEVDESSLPPELSGLAPEYIESLREFAVLDQCTLLEAHEYNEKIRRNLDSKLEWRRKHEKSGKHNRPTTAYRPKPLY
jgi:hypothetical protein